MNICGGGICVCDNYEYPHSQCSEASKPIVAYLPPWRRYYFDRLLGVVISIDDPEEMRPDVPYYKDPDLQQPHADS